MDEEEIERDINLHVMHSGVGSQPYSAPEVVLLFFSFLLYLLLFVGCWLLVGCLLLLFVVFLVFLAVA